MVVASQSRKKRGAAPSWRALSRNRYPFLEITTESVLIVDPEWRIAFINTRAEAAIGGGRDLLGEDFWDAFPVAIGTVFDEHFHAAMRGRSSAEFDAFYAPFDAWFHVRLFPVREGMMVLFCDTTDQQRAQQALRESELRFRTLADTVPEILFTADAAGRTDYMNRRFTEYTGLSAADGLGFRWAEALHPDDARGTLARWQSSLETGEAYQSEFRFRRHDGAWRWFVSRCTPIRDESGAITRWFGVCTDIDSQKQAEDALRHSETAVRSLLDAAPHGIVACNADGRIVLFNDAATRIFGYAQSEILGQTIDVLLPAHVRERHSQHRADFITRERLRLMGGGLDLMGCRNDGSQFPIEVSLSRVPAKNGELLVAFISDMSARREAEELHRANEALLRTNEELERFASQVSHDLREPLATVRSYADLALELHASELPRDVARALSVVQESADRMAELVSDLLGYARVGGRGRNHVQQANLGTALDAAVSNLESAIRASGAQVTHDDLPAIPADHVQMVQLFQNLIGNAIKYRGHESPRVHVTALFEDGIWLISVRDNGEGFAPEYAEDIFNAFERLHGDDIPGTGIGLATCRKIVEAHGGRIWAESQRGKGSTFRFILPGA